MNAAAVLLGGGVRLPPFVPAPKVYHGCMGRIVPSVPFIDGAYRECPELVFSWLLQRYPLEWQARILAFFRAAGDEDFLLSWADFDGSPAAFQSQILQVRAAGLRPLVMLASKAGPHDAADVIADVDPIMPVLKAAGVPRVCIGWELNSWISPEDLQILIDHYAPAVNGWGAFLYVHFTEGYAAWQPNGKLFADFWNTNVNKLRGVLHQKVQTQTIPEYLTGEGGLRDILLHFNGGNFCTADSGDGTPFDLVAFELDLDKVAHGTITEADMHAIGAAALTLPAEHGPTGPVAVMGSGCGV